MAFLFKSKKIRSAFSSLLFIASLSLCAFMIAATGYIKHQMDRNQATLAAPDTAFSPEQELYEKTVIALGYSGFIGAAQNFINTHDRAALGDMKMSFKTAQESVTKLSDKTTNVVRRDLQAILNIFASIIGRAEETGDALSIGISNTDILNAATSLATLDARLQAAVASTRLQAHTAMQTWSLGLMLITWGCLFFIAALSAYVFLIACSQNKEPLLSLAQSVENMTKGDLQNPVWGLERADEVGDVARSIERMRQYFTCLPDMTVESDNELLRVKFDGQTRSLFETMIQNIRDNFDKTQNSAAELASTMRQQHDAVTSTTARLDLVMSSLQINGENNERTIRDLSATLAEAAESLTASHKTGAAEIENLVPFMRERIQNMAEVTHLAGNQVSQSLKDLMRSETMFRNSAQQSEKVVHQLASATNQMGERMFAALNLMQASGKLLNDTTSAVRMNFNEAIETLGRGETHLQQIITRAENRLASTVNAEENMAALAARTESSAEKMEKAVSSIYERHESLSEQVVTATHRMESIVASFDAAQRAMSEATGQIRRDGNLIGNLLHELRANNDQLLASVSQNSQSSFNAAQGLAEKSHALMQRLEIQIQQQAQLADEHIEEISVHSKTMAQQALSSTSNLSQAVGHLKTEQEKLATIRTQFSDIINDLGMRFEKQATATFGKTEQWAAQSFTKLSSIAEQVEEVMKRLNMLGQLTGTLGTVAGQLGQLVPNLTGMQMAPSAGYAPDAPTADLEETKQLIVDTTEKVMQEVHNRWHEALVQIEAMHDQLAQIMVQQKDQLETRLVVMDKKLRDTQSDTQLNATDEKQADIMNEIIGAIAKINKHVIELDEVIEDAGLKKEA